MIRYADVLNPRPLKPKRPRIRRPSTLRLVWLKPGDPSPPPGRRNPHGWRFANQARGRNAKRRAQDMFILRLGRYSVSEIAAIYGTTRTAVYQQLYRLRSGFYDRRPPPKGPPVELKIEFVHEPAREREPEG